MKPLQLLMQLSQCAGFTVDVVVRRIGALIGHPQPSRHHPLAGWSWQWHNFVISRGRRV